MQHKQSCDYSMESLQLLRYLHGVSGPTRTLLPSRSAFCRSPTLFLADSTMSICLLLRLLLIRAKVIVCKGVPDTRAICPICVERDISLGAGRVLRTGLELKATGAEARMVIMEVCILADFYGGGTTVAGAPQVPEHHSHRCRACFGLHARAMAFVLMQAQERNRPQESIVCVCRVSVSFNHIALSCAAGTMPLQHLLSLLCDSQLIRHTSWRPNGDSSV